MTGLTVAMIVATVLESIYDTPTGQYFVYRSLWFYALLFLLGVNIFVVAVSRWPWKKHHTAFLLAHAGILLLLIGSWVTYQWGLDAMMRLKEGESSSRVEVNEPQLILTEGSKVDLIPVRWLPPMVKFKPFKLKEYPIEVSGFLSHADADYSFVPAAAPAATDPTRPAFAAVRLRVEGGLMRVRQQYWTWGGDRSYSRVQAGPATVLMKNSDSQGALSEWVKTQAMGRGPTLALSVLPSGEVEYVALSSAGEVKSGRVAEGTEVDPGWRGGVKVIFEKVIPRAEPEVQYLASSVQYGPQAPPSAIQIRAGGSEMWLGSGDRATLQVEDRKISIAYTPKTFLLPFSLRLDHFQIQYYEGTRNPSSYSSEVRVLEESPGKPVTISMNEPLEHKGLTFYQSSYEDAQPRPVVSIFTVNQDPGRAMKYLGSLLLVAGSILLFYTKLKQSRSRAVK